MMDANPHTGGIEEFDSCPELIELLRSRRAVGRSGRVYDGIEALSSLNNLISIRRLMHDLKPSRTLEVGLSVGGSALVFASSHRDLGHAPARQHVAIDPLQDRKWDDSGLRLIEQAGLGPYLDFRLAPSALELPRLFDSPRFGLIYVDGSHLFEDVFVDAYFTVRLLGEGGIVAFDDSTDPHVGKVLRFLRANCRESLEEIDLGPYRADAGRSLRYRIARRVGRAQLTAFRRTGEVQREWNAPFHAF